MSTNIILIFLACTFLSCNGAGLQRTNVVLITDYGRGNFQYSRDFVKSILDRISLLKYRVSFFTTNGVKQTLMNFQSRQCTVAKMSKKAMRKEKLTDIVKYALKDLQGPFPNDKSIVLILTDKRVHSWLKKLFNFIVRRKKIQSLFVNQIKYMKYKRLRSTTHTYKSWRYSHNHFHRYFHDSSSTNEYDDDPTDNVPHNEEDDTIDDDDVDDNDDIMDREVSKRKRRGVTLTNKIKISKLKNVEKVINALSFLKERTCSVSGKVYDECNRRCKCVDGKLTDCYRVRQEFSSMTKPQRLRFIDIYKKFSSERRFSRLYSSYVKKHYSFFFKGLHSLPQFLPWHRRYILGFENYLRAFDCRVTVPYWNWALHENEAWKVTSKHLTWSASSGLGGNGHSNHGFCVTDGPFAHRKWKPPVYESLKKLVDGICANNDDDYEQKAPYANKFLARVCKDNSLIKKCFYGKHCLRRRFSGKVPSYKNLYSVITKTKSKDFKYFESKVREDWHNLVHNRVGGEMETDYSSHTPEFWMHHGMLDCAWEKWQQKGHAYKYNHFRNKKTKLMAFKIPQYRYKFVQNDNLDNCGVKVTCENVLPKKLNLKKTSH